MSRDAFLILSVLRVVCLRAVFWVPTLFLLFINDIDEIVGGTGVRMKLFADDVKLYCSFDNFSHDLQIVCDKLTEWADKWQMKIAFNKCTVHRISNRDSHINQNPGYTIGGLRSDIGPIK